MTPAERIQRLREETARATTPSPRWELQVDHPLDYEGEPLLHHCDNDEVWVSDGQGVTVAGLGERYTNAPVDAAHIARWDPQAAARALDLLVWIFTWLGDDDPAYIAALALLDTIDPEGAD